METRKKILIIEDDNVLRNILSDHLGRMYEITQADDGEMGYKNILEFKPDLVILDLMLPKLSGLEMLEKVRQNPDPAIANTKVVIFSNFSSSEYILKAQVLNVKDYLVKADTSIEGLITKIESMLV